MKSRSAKAVFCIAVLGAAAVFATEDPFAAAELRGVTDRNPVAYGVGDPIEFSVSVAGVESWPDADNYFVAWLRTGDDGETVSGTERVGAWRTNFTVKTTLRTAGFVRLEARLMGPDYNPLFARKEDGQPRDIAFHGGAGAGVSTLRQAVPEPKDFDAFWARQKARLADVPLKAVLKDAPEFTSGKVRTWTVRIDCAGPRPATGYVSIPVGAKPKSLRAVVGFNGYGAQVKGFPPRPERLRDDEIAFRLNAFGYEMDGTKEYYRDFFASIRSPEYTYALDPAENVRPETCFFNGMVLRVLRALEYVKSLPEWNGRDLVVEGRSQGGLQTIWAAGLDGDVTEARPEITWCCDLGGFKAGRLEAAWRVPYVDELGYYDAVNFAKRVRCEVNITRAGLGDYICPPSGLAVLFNAIPTRKSINWYQGSRHAIVPPNPPVVHVNGNK